MLSVPSPKTKRLGSQVSASGLAACLLGSLILLFSTLNDIRAEERGARIKVGIFFYVLKFVEWAPYQVGDRLKVCIAGRDEVSSLFESTLKDKVIGKLPLEFVSTTGELPTKVEKEGCSVAYFPQETLEDKYTSRIRALDQNGSTLSVCGVARLRKDVCMIQLFEEDNRARIAVNRDIVRNFRCRISAELLDVAIDPSKHPTAVD